MKEILRDVSVYTTKAVTIVEIMGRDAGWLTASASLADPDLIYLPEMAFDPEAFLEAIKEIQKDHPAVLVAVSEGIRFADGRYVGEGLGGRKVDAFGHVALSGAGRVLEDLVKERIGCKVRSIELNLPQRCAAHVASKTDIDESVGVGSAAVKAATSGKTAVMMTINRGAGEEYTSYFDSANIAGIANGVKQVPREFITPEGNQITDECKKYIAPLIMGECFPEYENGLPKHIIL
jgi:6-phosphofructokinase 1